MFFVSILFYIRVQIFVDNNETFDHGRNNIAITGKQ